MSELRTRMLRDMTVRGFSPRTHEAYVRQVVGLARHYRRSPDQLSADEVQAYLALLFRERKRSWSTCAQAAHAFRFFYHVTLGRAQTAFHVPAPKQPQKLPDILSREEVWRLLGACAHPRDRLVLATTYAAGLRVSELVALKVADLDADRMTIHICQGKGGKDRYVPFSQRLLQDWRADWRVRPPHVWLFPNRQETRPIDITVAQKLYTLAKLRAGITKQGGIHALRHHADSRFMPARFIPLQNGHRALFINAQDLFDDLYASLADRSSRKLVDRLARVPVLCVDELGYLNLRPEQSNIFFKLMEERYRRRPSIITTNLDYDDWLNFLGNKHMVTALLSRLRHQCTTIRIDGPSLREPQG